MRVAFNLLFVISYIIIVADGEQFRCDYKHFPSADGWVKYYPIPANWHEARLRCHLEGANLASPLNEGLKAALRSTIPIDNDCGVFTGIHATFSRGDFFSVEGVPLREIPHKWATCEPNNINNDESCLLMTSQGELADVNCSDVYPYLCYKKSSGSMVLNECGTIDNEYKLNAQTGSCYKFHVQPRSWSRAYMTCAAEGAHLAIINSQEEAKVLGHIFSENKSHFWANTDKGVAFVGIHDWNEHGEWLTIEGQMLEQAGYAGWKKGEPNNQTSDRNIGQYCGAIDEFGLLDDATCTGHFDYMHTFICEKHPDPLLCNNYKEESN